MAQQLSHLLVRRKVRQLLPHSSHSRYKVESELGKQTWKFIQHQSTTGMYESILISPQSDSPAPLIAYPHGGPHSNTPSAFVGLFSYFVSLGYHVLLTNYRGSLGFGQPDLEGLCGKCGFQDVQDVKNAIEQVSELVSLRFLISLPFLNRVA